MTYAIRDGNSRPGSPVTWLDGREPYFSMTFGTGAFITAATHDESEAWRTDDKAAAEALLPRLNRSPFSKWEVVEVA